jgi:hypothetical protein
MTQKEVDRARGTHILETMEGGKSQDTEGKRPNEGHSPAGGGRGSIHNSGQKEADRVRGTHVLETIEGGTSQDTERNRPRKGNSLSGDGRGRDKSGRGMKPTE